MRRSSNGEKSTTTRISSMPAFALLVGTRRFRFDCQLLILLGLLLGGMVSDSLAAAKFVTGLVPDWNQPYRYPPPNGGPGPDPGGMPGVVNQWNAWCAPSSAANLAGHWTDARGLPEADTVAFPGSTVPWANGPSWQDYLADGTTNRPGPQAPSPIPGPLPSSPTDIGWYLDTNRGIPYDPPGIGTMGGYFFFGNPGPHTGTFLKDIHAGLQNYLNSRYSLSGSIFWKTGTRGRSFAAGVNPAGFPAVTHPNEFMAFAEVKSEIDSNRTLLLTFIYWNPAPTPFSIPATGTNTEAAYGGLYCTWGTTPVPPYTNQEDEVWDFGYVGTNMGHVVTCVGVITNGDVADLGPTLGLGKTDWVIVHDNWSTTPRNVIIPYGTPGPPPQFNAAWVANTTVVPWPTNAKFVKGLVPDWNQPYHYPPQVGTNNGGPPGGDPLPNVVNQWNAWCAPTAAANLAGHWTDYHGAPVADSTAFDGSTMVWPDPSWQDYLADGTAPPAVPCRPGPQAMPGLLPVPTTDIGWYMDSNLGVPYDWGAPGPGMGGFFFGNPAHNGTYVKDIHAGLQNFLNSRYCVAGPGWDTGTAGKAFAFGLNPMGGAAVPLGDPASAFNQVVTEINHNHTLIVSFKHWNIGAAAAGGIPSDGTNTEAVLGGSYYSFETSPGSSNAEDEQWNMDDSPTGLGHAVTVVGYVPAGDVLDPGPSLPPPLGVPTDWVIVHDNWASTPRNVIVPFDYANNWVANTIAYPDSGFLRITGVEVAARTNAVISFTGVPGCLHHLEWKSEITNSTWTTCVSNQAFCAGTMQVTNTAESSIQQRFYRVKASY